MLQMPYSQIDHRTIVPTEWLRIENPKKLFYTTRALIAEYLLELAEVNTARREGLLQTNISFVADNIRTYLFVRNGDFWFLKRRDAQALINYEADQEWDEGYESDLENTEDLVVQPGENEFLLPNIHRYQNNYEATDESDDDDAVMNEEANEDNGNIQVIEHGDPEEENLVINNANQDNGNIEVINHGDPEEEENLVNNDANDTSNENNIADEPDTKKIKLI